MKAFKSIFCLFLVLTLLCGCTAGKTEEKETTDRSTSASETEASSETQASTSATETSSVSSSTASSAPTTKEKTTEKKTQAKTVSRDIEELISSMSLEEKVGQLFVVFPEALYGTDGTAGLNDKVTDDGAVISAGNGVRASIQKYHIGGVVMFAKNITTPSQIKQFNKDLQSASDIPLFIAVDEEGGSVARLGRNDNFDLPTYRSAASVASSGRESDAYSMGATIGSYLKRYGFNMDFAPVADVNSNPDNPVIGNRSFSSDPAEAARMAGACARGLRSAGIIPTFKHFPGHGDTAEDSHQSLAVNRHDMDRLMKDDWLPYLNNDLNGCAVMVGHIALPNVTGNMRSAVVDREIVTDYLRGKIGFDGLVITDSLKMQGVSNYYDTGTACIKALNAGCDILLMPQYFVKSYNAVLNAVKDGTVSEERIDESLRRIFEMKRDYNII